MIRNYLFLVLLSISAICYCQQRDYIFGQLVDATQNEPIPFASIRVKGAAMGVISNIDGTFRIPMRYKSMGEILEISCMGYGTKNIPMRDLRISEANIIVLQPSAMELKEAVVKAKLKKLNARELMRMAIARIPQNYPLMPYSMVGYYRDYQVKNGSYTNLNEAVVNLYDEGFSKKDNFDNQYELFSYRHNTDFEVDPFAKQPYDYGGYNKVIPHAKMENTGGNELITLMIHDAIRNYQIDVYSFINDMSLDFLENHRFRLMGTTNYKDTKVYNIACYYRDNDYRSEGRIFLDTGNFSILKLDYSLYRRKKPGENDKAINPLERYSDGFKETEGENLYRIITEYYKGEKDKMYLGYISFYNKMLIQRPPEFFSKLVVDLRDNSFKIRLNKVPANLDEIKNGDFKIKYKGELLPIKDFFFSEDERRFTICPHTKYTKVADALEYIFTENDKAEIANLNYSYGEIRDSLGNKLDERKWEYLHQYREFFVQETTPFSTIGDISKDSLMHKMKPLDSEIQHISKQALKKDYWMNTPLPNVTN
ncbi:carboxypeptidase-like regulatory domain-containing protein [Maribacter sp. PR1]|uniref:Carboxypeptidase-like regulatory domain-containing protein n=1 Tax=Maribacter cobaltidurans TaxID=1178778 RepID=A0ABU7IXR4_9FLAO|nr:MULTISPECIES: carboxypeptidase-like regulatory domain-containing protein [Maribacter]MDC6390393.1 carboxypeptidase-like regulatory domain-containing protein [Maribacter sp. PR1]MEE1977782.1 carboxypeptidase-like regulatory domain-containing protein [Maribacter cobaltidurans]